MSAGLPCIRLVLVCSGKINGAEREVKNLPDNLAVSVLGRKKTNGGIISMRVGTLVQQGET